MAAPPSGSAISSRASSAVQIESAAPAVSKRA